MINKLIEFSLRVRGLVIAAIVGAGYQFNAS